ncbi:MAG: hypothetical protein HY234_00610 [Acidobacteria bacterium]|nr:hypothetical protein [Acidobacteriota bacterium]MBI3661542.1 hypothetical protein [Acidobacteriota bacterium]
MKCFNHRDQDAIAICKHCGKGLCQQCVVETAGGASCRGNCEENVAALHLLLLRGKKVYQKTSKAQLRTGIFIVVMGSAFLVFGVLEEIPPLKIGLCTMGTIFIIWGVFVWRSAREFKQV